jgi:hypothetical protein
VILEPRVVLLYYFLEPWLAEGDATLTQLEPRGGSQSQVTFTRVGVERVRLGRRMVEARHYRLDGGGPSCHVWFDDQGRVVALEIPDEGFRAERRTS